MELLKVLYLPPFPPSVTYRPWAPDDRGFSLLGWFVTRLVAKYGKDMLLIACQDECDRSQAEQASAASGVFVSLCPGDNLLEALGDIAGAFPSFPIAYFHLEMMFAPSDLLDRVSAHHAASRNDFTYVSDLPSRLAPEIADSSLLAALARISLDACAPPPLEAVMKLRELRMNAGSGSVPRAEPFSAGCVYELPPIEHFSQLIMRDDADRARQVLMDLPPAYQFEAIQRWHGTTFQCPPLDLSPESPGVEGPSLLYLSPGSFYSGAEECLVGLARTLAGLNVRQVAVVGLEGLLAERLRESGCRVISANWNFAAAETCVEANARFACEVLDAVNPDCIHCNSIAGPGFIKAARVRKKRMISHVRTTRFDGREALHRAATHLIAVSRFVKQQLVLSGIPPERITVVYDGVDVERFSPGVFNRAEMRKRFNLPQDAFIVLMVARPDPQKCHTLMLKAFAEISRGVPCARLVFVGDFGQSHFVRAMRYNVQDPGIADSINWLPFLADIREIECAADVVVLPSDGEALGTCILEAMSLAIPVVVSDAGGTHELIEEGFSGLTMAGGDVGSLTSILMKLAASESLRSEIGRNARQRVERHFSLGHRSMQVLKVLLP